MDKLSSTKTIFIGITILVVIVTSSIVFVSLNPSPNTINLSTTTSTEDSGLLDVIDPMIKRDTGIIVEVSAVGTGQALENARLGEADVVMVHARSLENIFIDQGYGLHRVSLMHDDFILVGPSSDPAHIMGMTNASQAFKQLYDSRNNPNVKFVSRGDNSGTYVREMYLWNKSVGINASTSSWQSQNKNWYIDASGGMAHTLTVASESQAYTLTDRPTYLKLNSTSSIKLNILAQNPRGDPDFQNQYGVILVNPAKFPDGHIRFDTAKRYVEWLISNVGQNAIGNYTIAGKQVFFPDFASFKTTMSASELAFWGLS